MVFTPEPPPRQHHRIGDSREAGPRFDGHRYRDCRWCGGRGCLLCEQEVAAAYKREFPNGPQPIATIKIEEIGQLKDVLGPGAIERYKREGGFDDGSFAADLATKLADIRGQS